MRITCTTAQEPIAFDSVKEISSECYDMHILVAFTDKPDHRLVRGDGMWDKNVTTITIEPSDGNKLSLWMLDGDPNGQGDDLDFETDKIEIDEDGTIFFHDKDKDGSHEFFHGLYDHGSEDDGWEVHSGRLSKYFWGFEITEEGN